MSDQDEINAYLKRVPAPEDGSGGMTRTEALERALRDLRDDLLQRAELAGDRDANGTLVVPVSASRWDAANAALALPPTPCAWCTELRNELQEAERECERLERLHEAAEADRDREKARADAAEAERDRLRAVVDGCESLERQLHLSRELHSLAVKERDALRAVIDAAPKPDWTEIVLGHPWPAYYRDHILPNQTQKGEGR